MNIQNGAAIAAIIATGMVAPTASAMAIEVTGAIGAVETKVTTAVATKVAMGAIKAL